jgi:hypothetical protein
VEPYLPFACLHGVDKENFTLFFFVYISDKSGDGRMVGVRVRNYWKEEIVTVTEVLFRSLFVGTEKNHENLVITGGMVEFRPEYKF